jgi:hypothetical protein
MGFRTKEKIGIFHLKQSYEWHLHEYSLKLIMNQIKDLFEIIDIKRIPVKLLPFRYVLKLKKIS